MKSNYTVWETPDDLLALGGKQQGRGVSVTWRQEQGYVIVVTAWYFCPTTP